jgi:poly-gamma-glutamate capsule biosynthesis protein CapA/YwtB (metallophosphatase superfamily)
LHYESERGDIQIVLTGDSIVTRPMSVYREPKFLELTDLVRGSDVAVTNAEMLFHNFESSPTAVPGGSYMRASPSVIKDLRWLGIDVVATANNHSYDYGENGLLTNLEYLNEFGMPHAGTGRNLAAARSAVYLDTRAGRVALISITSSGPAGMTAAHQWREGQGRPGANMLRYTSRITVDSPTFEGLRKLGQALGKSRFSRSAGYRDHSWGMSDLDDSPTEFYLRDLHEEWQYVSPEGYRIALGDEFGRELVPYQLDVDENLQRIADARRMADWVVVSMHNHEAGETLDDPSTMAVDFAHQAIDAGADVFHGHGPHRDRGIEIYHGRPIFYSIGHFIVQSDTIEKMAFENYLRQRLDPWQSTPADFYESRAGREWMDEWIGTASLPHRWEDAVAVVEFSNRRLSAIRLQPIEFGFHVPRSQRGRPMIADLPAAGQVIERFGRLSQRFGTRIQNHDGVGVIDIAAELPRLDWQPGLAAEPRSARAARDGLRT